MPHREVWICTNVSEETAALMFMVEEQIAWERRGVAITMSGL
jgi:hypothetical protein